MVDSATNIYQSRNFLPRTHPLPDSLLKLCVKCVARDLSTAKNSGYLNYLPMHIKNAIILYVTRAWGGFHDDDIFNLLVNKDLMKIDLSTSTITDRTLEILGTACPGIRKLIINRAQCHFTKSGLLSSIPRLTNLEVLQLNNSDFVDNDFVHQLAENCPKLDLLDVSGSRNLTDECLGDLIKLKITKLNISNTKITDDFLVGLADSPLGDQIDDINVSQCDITAIGLARLRWDKLKFIGFQGCSINGKTGEISGTLLPVRIRINCFVE